MPAIRMVRVVELLRAHFDKPHKTEVGEEDLPAFLRDGQSFWNPGILPRGEPMSRTIELPDAVYAALEKAAQADGTTPADWIAAQIPATTPARGETFPPNHAWLDRDFLKTYAQDGDDSVTLDEVRRAMAKIPGRLADDIRAERDER
jgi:hypothetical protein